jgi:hypothetical protein
LFAVIRLPPANQGTARNENDRNFSTQRNFLEGRTINQTGKKNSSSAKEAAALRLGRCPSSKMIEGAVPQGGTASDLKAEVASLPWERVNICGKGERIRVACQQRKRPLCQDGEASRKRES